MTRSIKDLLANIGHEFAPELVSKLAINAFANATTPRPRPYSLWSDEKGKTCDYVSWPSLTDRTFSGRHLRAASESYTAGLPEDATYDGVDPGEHGVITGLFKRTETVPCPRSSLLFPLFAQWFTDSFLRADPKDRRKNTSNHEIDLCQIYGLTEETANLLRTKNGGKLKSQMVGTEEYPDNLFGDDGEVKPEYGKLPYVKDNRYKGILKRFGDPENRKENYFATGLERGNSTVGYTAISTLFLREHNRLCDELNARNPAWNGDDERLFQTARNINITLLLKIVIEDYINHISPVKAPIFMVDTSFAEEEEWYRTNWMAVEFDLLYRWHGLVPNTMTFGGATLTPPEFMLKNDAMIEKGLGVILDSSSKQRAGKIALHNTPDFLLRAEHAAIKMGRDYRLRPFNEYRVQFGLDELDDYDDLTSDKELGAELKSLYGDIDNLEFFIGLFAEQGDDNELFGDLMLSMVASDAFTQALTNPLLSKHVFNKDTFTKYGLKVIKNTNSLQHLVARNVANPDTIRASFTF
ncbi:peroxidase family protein [Kiloniella sp.]|uniref:peroxidase family protein n=1 Tax=Kiloniella sp. TaxID=1938587 RepID=UPI003B0221E6